MPPRARPPRHGRTGQCRRPAAPRRHWAGAPRPVARPLARGTRRPRRPPPRHVAPRPADGARTGCEPESQPRRRGGRPRRGCRCAAPKDRGARPDRGARGRAASRHRPGGSGATRTESERTGSVPAPARCAARVPTARGRSWRGRGAIGRSTPSSTTDRAVARAPTDTTGSRRPSAESRSSREGSDSTRTPRPRVATAVAGALSPPGRRTAGSGPAPPSRAVGPPVPPQHR